jgi:glyoxylase-like metal-dependent hydrolase (beta-lactamase superfamily II)
MCSARIGDVQVTFVPDGSIHLPPGPMYANPEEVLFAEHPEYIDSDGLLVMSLGSILVQHAGTNTLIDLGWGPDSFDIAAATGGARAGFVESGALIENLGVLGLTPADIDVVALTHLHRDHIGWLMTPDGRARFESAQHHLSRLEWNHWNEQVETHWGGPSRDELRLLDELIQPLEDGDAIAPAVRAVETAGHTPGHFSFVVSSGAGRAIVLGDAVHCPLELERPDLRLAADIDSEAAHDVRNWLRDQLSDGTTLSIGTHFPQRVFGRIVTIDGQLRVQPTG